MKTLIAEISKQKIPHAKSDSLIALMRTKNASTLLSAIYPYPFHLYDNLDSFSQSLASSYLKPIHTIFIRQYGAYFLENNPKELKQKTNKLLELIESFIKSHISLPCRECDGKTDPSIISNLRMELETYTKRPIFIALIDSPQGQFFTILPNLELLIHKNYLTLLDGTVIPPPMILNNNLSDNIKNYSCHYCTPLPNYIILKGVGVAIIGEHEQRIQELGTAIKQEIMYILIAEQLGGAI